jgi:diacylglycerol kinase family enzyme
LTIKKGEPWGVAAPLPADGVIVRSDAEARAAAERARRQNEAIPTLGLLGGDLCRTLGGLGDASRLHSAEAVTFPVDLGSVLVDGRLHWFVAHLVARSRGWGRAFVAMNAQWRGGWNLAPKAHPNDGLLDTFDARLPLADRLKVRARLPTGAHLPHPGIRGRRTAAVQVEFERPLEVELDGEAVGRARTLSVRIEADALRVVV